MRAALRYNHATYYIEKALSYRPGTNTGTVLIIPLCQTHEISDPGSKAFEIKLGGKNTALFVVHKDGAFNAYINSCPHTGANLEWQEDQFLDLDNMYIQCSTHDALFEIESGKCIAGPCVGDSLQTVELLIEDGQISAQFQPV